MLDEKCGYCKYCMCDYDNMKRNDEGKFYCDRENIWVSLKGKPILENCFWTARGAIMNDRYRLVEGHYITTVLIILAGFERDCYELITLDWFRTNVLEKKSEYAEVLAKYDEIGPTIADKLYEAVQSDPESYKEYLAVLLNSYVRKTCNYINKGKNYLSLNDNEMADVMFKRAIVVYSSMVNNLYNEFVLGNNYSYEQEPELEQQKVFVM